MHLRLQEGQAPAPASSGFSSTDPNRTEADFWSDVQNDVVKEHLIASRLGTALQGVPFLGQYADELIGAVAGPEAKTATRVAQEAMQDTRPGQSLALQVGGGAVGALPAIAALPAAAPAIPGALGARFLAGLGFGVGGGALEGAISGFGAGNGGDRLASARGGAGTGALVGGAVGGAAPLVSAGVKNAAR